MKLKYRFYHSIWMLGTKLEYIGQILAVWGHQHYGAIIKDPDGYRRLFRWKK